MTCLSCLLILLVGIMLHESLSFVSTSSNSVRHFHAYRQLLMNKDGKKKKPAKSASNSPSLSAASTVSTSATNIVPANRVSTKINVPIRQQIQWARMNKKLMQAASTSSSFHQIAKKYRRSNNSYNATSSSSTSDDDSGTFDYHSLLPPIVLVDGYNIIGNMRFSTLGGDDYYGSNSNSVMTSTTSYMPSDLQEAREQLINDLAVLHSTTGWCIELVFDANNREHYHQNDDFSNGNDDLSIIYTREDESADAYIERRFHELSEAHNGNDNTNNKHNDNDSSNNSDNVVNKSSHTNNKPKRNIMIATNDQLIRVGTSLGTTWNYLSAEMLLEEIRIAYKTWDFIVDDLETSAIRINNKNTDKSSSSNAHNKEQQLLHWGIPADEARQLLAVFEQQYSTQSVAVNTSKIDRDENSYHNIDESSDNSSSNKNKTSEPSAASSYNEILQQLTTKKSQRQRKKEQEEALANLLSAKTSNGNSNNKSKKAKDAFLLPNMDLAHDSLFD